MTASKLKPLNIVSNLDRYGSVVGQPSPERVLRLGKAIKCIIAADGTVSDAELSAFAQLAVQFGASEASFAELVAFDPKSTTLAECLRGLEDDALSRRMIYDAIHIASADGYAPAERAAVRTAAKTMNIDEGTVTLLEGLVEAELGLATMRARLLG